MYKVNINFVLLLAVGVCFHCGLGRRVSLDDGNFNVSWMYSRESDELYFEVEVYAEGWVGFGFTFTPEEMRNYDLVIGGQTDTGESYFNDFFTSGFGIPDLDSKQSYILDRATKLNGKTTLRYHRPRNTNDTQDIQFHETTRVFLVWAYHDVDDASNPSMFSMHTRRNHSMGSFHILYANSNPMISTQGTITAERESEPSTARPVRVTAKVKSIGIQLGGSFLMISFLTILNFLVKYIQ